MSDQIQRDDGEWQMLLNNAYSMVDSLTNRVEARDAQVESLQRENQELKAERDHAIRNRNEWATKHAELDKNSVPRSRYEVVCIEVEDWKARHNRLYDKSFEEIKRLEAAAITPEMRETAEKWLKDYAPGHTVDYIAMALSGRVIIHDLLGKQG